MGYGDHQQWDMKNTTILAIYNSNVSTGNNMGGIMIGLIQRKYTVNVVVSNMQFYHMHQVITNIYIESTSHVVIENCTFMLNQLIPILT